MAKEAQKTRKAVPTIDAAPGDGRAEYLVTDTAPSRVASRRVKAGDTIQLTEAEARGELLALHIKPKAPGLTEEQVDAVRENL